MITKDILWKLADVQQHSQFQNFLESLIDKSDERESFYSQLLKEGENCLDDDLFRQYFEEYAAERKSNQQDFTPKEVAQLMNQLIFNENSKTFADFACGTGSLMCEAWYQSKHKSDLFFLCEELSDITIPYLIHNLAIRNVSALVIHGNTLSEEVQKVYRLSSTLMYSDIEEVETFEIPPIDEVIMNPPYSAKWDSKNDERFEGYGVAPKGRADLAFLLHGMHHLSDVGKMTVLLPSGVLFRDGQEKEIRKQLILKEKLDGIIFLPENLFESTTVPTQIMIIDPNKKDNDLFIVDIMDRFKKGKNKNKLEQSTINEVLEVYQDRKETDKLSKKVTLEDIEQIDFNLNVTSFFSKVEESKQVTCLELVSQMIMANAVQQAALQNICRSLSDVLIDEMEELGLLDETEDE